MKIQTLILFLLTVISFRCQSQDLNLLKSLAKYRSNVLLESSQNIEDLNSTLVSWKKAEPNAEFLQSFIFNIQYAKEIRKYNNKLILKLSSNYSESQILSKIATADQINSIVQNPQLTDLMTNGLITDKYPYQIKENKFLFKEIDFYQIRENDIIAEIGAGQGMFSKLLYMLDRSNKILVNEINHNLLIYINSQLKKNNLDQNSSQIILVKGNKKKINIAEKVDKIIVRNTLHHFKKKDKMLASIKETLKPAGKLFINESVLDPAKKRQCKSAMTEAEIKQVLSKAGFKYIRELKIDGSILLEYEN